jgi:toxin FitB
VNLVDSCGWLEYLADTEYSRFYAKAIEDTDNLIVPTICIFEVFKKVLKERGEDSAFKAVALMKQADVIPLDEGIAISSGKISVLHSIPMADSIVYATALACDATVLTQDNDLRGLQGVKVIEKA